MAKLLALAVLLCAVTSAPASVSDIPKARADEIAAWFQMTGVRWAIYTEYILPNDTAQVSSMATWAAKKGESMKPTFAKSQSAYLAGAMKEADRFQTKWSEGIREVLKVSTLSREEA